MTDAMVKAFLLNWVDQMGLNPLFGVHPRVDGLAEVIWVHAWIDPKPDYWPQMHRIIMDLAAEL